MGVGTSLGDSFDDEFHYQQSLHDPDKYPPNNTPPEGPTEPAGASKPSGGTKVASDTNASPEPSQSLPALSFLRAGKALNDTIDSTVSTLAHPEEALSGFYNHVKNAFSLPGDVYGGKIDPNSQQGIERATDLAGLMVFGPAPVARSMADGTLGSFAGVMAKSANMKDLDAARMLTKEGVNSEDVWKGTGWFHDKMDDRWKFEIPDQGATLKKDFNPTNNNVYHLDEVLDHPKLFDAYPHLKNIPVTINNNLGNNLGLANRNGITLNAAKIAERSGPEGLQDVLNHEIQHKIQEFEGFGTGSSPDRAYGDVRSSVANLIHKTDVNDPKLKDLQNLYSDLSRMGGGIGDSKFANYLYQRVPGEVEANRSMSRRLLSDDQRWNWPPEEYDKFMEGNQNYLSGGKYYLPSGIPFKSSDAARLKDLSPEAIKSAALKYKGDIFEDQNHGMALGKLGEAHPNFDMNDFGSVDQGFTTTHGRFVDREEAFKIANGQNQIDPQVVRGYTNDKGQIASPYGEPVLLSEDLSQPK